MGRSKIENIQQTDNKIEALYGLKFLATMLLLLHHIAYAFTINEPTRSFLKFDSLDLYPLMMNGWIGFDLFVVLCGFLAVRTWLLKPERTYRQYVAKRFWRILPTYYAVMLLLIIGAFPFFVPLEPLTWFSLAYHIALLPDVFFSNIMVLFSTIAVELKYILIVPVLVGFSLTRSRPTLTLCALAALLISLGLFIRDYGFSQYTPHDALTVNGNPVYRENIFNFGMLTRISFFCWFEAMFIGVGIAYFEHLSRSNTKIRISKKAAQIVFMSGLAILLFWLGYKDYYQDISRFDAVFQPIFTASIVGLLVFGSVFGGAPKMFSGKISRYFSPLTIPIFLVHLPLMFPAYLLIYIYFPQLMDPQHAPAFICVTVVYLVLTWIVAELVHRLVQVRLVNVVRRFLKIT